MAETLLKPPARFSHALLLVLTVVIALGLGTATGQHPALYVALITMGLFLGGFWAFSQETVALTAVGTVAVQLGSVGLLITTLWVLVGGLGTTSLSGFLLRVTIALALIAAIIAVLADLLPARVVNQDGPMGVAMLYGAGLASGLVVIVTAVQLGLASLFGATTASLLGTLGDFLLELAAKNPITRGGSLAMLVGVALWGALWLSRLPLSRRLSRGLALRWQIRTAESRGPNSAESESDGGSSIANERDEPSIGAILGIGSRGLLATRLLSAAVFYLGFGAVALGLAPELQTFANTHPIPRRISSILWASTAPHRLLVGVLLILAVLRLFHAAVWRGVNIEWEAYGRRVGYSAGSVVVQVGAALAGRSIVGFLFDTPALQFVPMGDSGPIIVPTDAGIRLAESGLSGFSLQPQPGVFEAWFGGLIALIGPSVVGITLLAVVLVLGILLFLIAVMFGASARITHPAVGIGLLFVAAAGATVIGASEALAFVAGAGSLLAWELYTYGGSLNGQLDQRASTLTAELVHLGVSTLLIGVAVVLTLVAARAVRAVPAPDAQWQLVGALVLSLTGLILGLLYLGLRGDQPRTAAETT